MVALYYCLYSNLQFAAGLCINDSKSNFSDEDDYSFVLDSSRHETEFIQEYKDPLQELGISLTFLANNGPAYWAAVDPIRRSLAADLLVFGLLMVVALILAVFLYVMQRKRDYAILRALGVPVKQANGQLISAPAFVGRTRDHPGWASLLELCINPGQSLPIHPADASRGLSFRRPQSLLPGRFVRSHFPSPGIVFLAGCVFHWP